MKNKKIFYYETLQDDFFDDGKEHRLSDGYRWIRTDFWSRFLSAFIYALAIIFSNVYCRIFLHVKIVGAKSVRKEKSGFFIYGNHTQPIGDVFNPALVCFPKRIYTVANAANMDLAFIGKILPYLGALPIPETVSGMKRFQKAIEYRINGGHPVIIYPEAHVWEYYTGIRPFGATSFKYPVNLDTPVYCMTTTYKKRKFGKKPKTVIYIDGPFAADGSKKERAEKLCKQVYKCMVKRSKQSDCEYIEYILKPMVD